MTNPEVLVAGSWLSGIAGWGDLTVTHRYPSAGSWECSWSMPLAPHERPAGVVRGARVSVRLGPQTVWSGSLAEPNWDTGEMTARGACREAEAALALAATGQTTTKPDVAIDQGIARGVLSWTRPASLSPNAVGQADGSGTLNYVSALLDAWAAENGFKWQVDAQRRVAAVMDPTTPTWHVTPDVTELGVADDETVDRVFVRYDSGSGNLATASYPTTTPAGGVERYVSVVSQGALTETRAGVIAFSIWSKLQAQTGWANGLEVTSTEISSPGGTPAHLGLVRAGDLVRIHGLRDPRGLAKYVDVVLGETIWKPAENTLTLNPVGLVARDLASVVEAVAPGATVLS